jgi:prolipoprotein diacylglyceryltransferase
MAMDIPQHYHGGWSILTRARQVKCFRIDSSDSIWYFGNQERFQKLMAISLFNMILYSVIPVFAEYFRADKLTFLGNITAAQSIGIIGLLSGLSLIALLNIEKKA